MRSSRRHPVRLAFLAGTVALSAVTLSACGVNTSDTIVQDDRRAAAERENQQRADAASAEARHGDLPTRPPGTIAVGMRVPESVTSRAITRAASGPSPVKYDVQVAETDTGIQDLCAGRIDLLQTARRLSAAEHASCAANGLKVDKPVIIGYAVAVLVTRNGTDIGGDCLTLGGVKSLLAVNSTVTNWQQIGFANHEFAVAGPPANSAVMQPIGRLALGFPIGGLGQGNLRSSMQVFTQPNDTGAFIAGNDRQEALDRQTRNYVRRVTIERRSADANAVARAERDAANAVVRQINAENRRRTSRGESVADPAALEARNAKRVADAKRKAGAEQRAINRRSISRLSREYRTEQRPSYLGDGRLAIVGYPYYEAHSDVLRPLEIDPRTKSAAGSRPDCRFPSQHTIADGSYPLTLPVYLYGDARTLRGELARPLLRTLLDDNADLTRMNDVAGLSAAAVTRTRRELGVGTDTTPAPTTSPSPASPSTTTSTTPAPPPAPGGIPGVDAPQATP
ncbi:MAG: substrate-binding domain-containing protein [Patulibacter sp.]